MGGDSLPPTFIALFSEKVCNFRATGIEELWSQYAGWIDRSISVMNERNLGRVKAK